MHVFLLYFLFSPQSGNNLAECHGETEVLLRLAFVDSPVRELKGQSFAPGMYLNYFIREHIVHDHNGSVVIVDIIFPQEHFFFAVEVPR